VECSQFITCWILNTHPIIVSITKVKYLKYISLKHFYHLLYEIWMSIVTQQCVVTISPVPYVFFVGIFWRKWKLYIFGKLKSNVGIFSSPPWAPSWIFKMAAVFLKIGYILGCNHRINMFLVSKYTFSRSRYWMEWLRML